MASKELIAKIEAIENYAHEHGMTYTKACAVFHVPRYTFYTLKKKTNQIETYTEKLRIINAIKSTANYQGISLDVAARQLGTTRWVYERYVNDLRADEFKREDVMTKAEFIDLRDMLKKINVTLAAYYKKSNVNLDWLQRKFNIKGRAYKRDEAWAMRAAEMLKTHETAEVEKILKMHRSAIYRELKRYGLK